MSKAGRDDFPIALAIWQTDHSLLFINNHAAQLTGLANVDLSEATALWSQRVHVDDRVALSSSWAELRKGTRQSTCDYRFFPKHSKTAIRLTEVSVLTPGLQRVVSVYFRIADLSEEPKRKETERVVRTVLHDVQNKLHAVKMEIELSQLGLHSTLAASHLAKSLSSVKQLPRDLRDYLGANATSIKLEDLEKVLNKIVLRMEYRLRRQKPNPRLVRSGPVPPVKVNKYQACSALGRIVESCRLKPGDGSEVEARDVRGKPDAELSALLHQLEKSSRDRRRPGSDFSELLQASHLDSKTLDKASDNLDEGLIKLMDRHI